MRKYVVIAAYLFNVLYLSGQKNVTSDKISLKTGEVYIGTIVLKTDDMIMINTNNGTRFQFQLKEVSKIEHQNSVESTERVESNDTKLEENTLENSKSTFGGLIEVSVGGSAAKYSFKNSPNTQLSLIFGNKNSFDTNLFLGAGIGYNSIYDRQNSQKIDFLPFIMRIQSGLEKKRTAPYISMDVGYAFALNPEYKGGMTIRISTGITRRINYKLDFSLGVYVGVQSFYGTLIETNELGAYSYYGKTTMNSIGIKTGLAF